MKKAITLALVLVLALSMLTACGSNDNTGSTGSNSNTPDNSQGANNNGSAAIKDITTENWEAVAKTHFSLDVPMPNGWKVNEAKSPNGVNNIDVKMTTDSVESAAEYAEKIFNFTATEVYGINSTAFATVGGDKLESFADAGPDGIKSWKYATEFDDGIYNVITNAFYDGTSFELSLTKSRVTAK